MMNILLPSVICPRAEDKALKIIGIFNVIQEGKSQLVKKYLIFHTANLSTSIIYYLNKDDHPFKITRSKHNKMLYNSMSFRAVFISNQKEYLSTLVFK